MEQQTSELTAAESQAFSEFSDLYMQMNPAPERPTAQIVSLLGWEFWVMGLIGFSSLILSALRTGSYFYLAAAGIQGLSKEANGFLGIVEAVAAVLTYEGFLLMMGVMDGKKRSMSPLLKWGSIILVLLTSTAAGLGVSLNIIQDAKAASNSLLGILGIFMGLASFLAFFSGELLGMIYSEAQVKVQEVMQSWRNELSSWEKARKNSWEAKRVKMIRRVGGAIDEERASAPVEQQQQKADVNVTDLVEAWLQKNNVNVLEKQISSNYLATVLSEEVGGTINPASVRKAIQRARAKRSNGHNN